MSVFESNLVINGKELTRKYVESLNYEEREALIEPIFKEFRKLGFVYPDNVKRVEKDYRRLCDLKMDLSKKELFNNTSVGTYICKYFCKSFFRGTEMKKGKKTPDMIELFHNDDVLRRIIRNRLGLEWYKQKHENDIEAFCISPRQIVQGMRSSRTVSSLTIFKPEIARHVYEKYSNEGDLIYDYSAGYGGRMLGANVCNRRYIGVDPLTIPELLEMREFFDMKGCSLIHGCSEDIVLKENSIDLSFSSPPYFNQEAFSDSKTQAYAQGEGYFYNVYWKKTLDNIKIALKPNHIFALNVKNHPRMLKMAGDRFTLKDQIGLRTVRSHLNKKSGVEKLEYIYIFEN